MKFLTWIHQCNLNVTLISSWLSSLEIDRATRVQILDNAVCISHGANILGKYLNPTILPQDIGKTVSQTGFFSLGIAIGL